MDNPPLASLSLTHVHYDPTDKLSFICAWLSLVPQGLMIVYASLLWSTREAEILLMFAGQMGCEACNWLLKRYIKEERPQQMHGKGYGMPSSHAQFATFFSLYLTLFLLLRHQPHPSQTHTPLSFTQRFILSILALLSAASVAASRVYLNYHTPRQVLVGCAAGGIIALTWFVVTVWIRRSGLLEWALDTEIAKNFRIRDLVVTEDLMDAGWLRWQEQRKKRSVEKKNR